jgi:phage terminase Nu1 subunit (DNA packaging protein)
MKRRSLKTRDDVAGHFGVSVRTVATWLREGMPGEPGTPGKSDGRFDVKEIEAWLAARGGVKTAEPNPSRVRQDTVRADLLELKLAELKGELLPAAEYVRRMTRIIHEAKGLLDQLPTRLSRLLPEKTPAAARARHRERVQRTLDATYLALEEIFSAEADAIEAADPATIAAS